MRLMSAILARAALRFSLSLGGNLRDSAASLPRSLGSILDLLEALPLVGKSRIWPTLDFTTKSLPRYLFMVFALAGDSTMTSDFPIILLNIS